MACVGTFTPNVVCSNLTLTGRTQTLFMSTGRCGFRAQKTTQRRLTNVVLVSSQSGPSSDWRLKQQIEEEKLTLMVKKIAFASALGFQLRCLQFEDVKLTLMVKKIAIASALGLSVAMSGSNLAMARPEGVNRPELLPREFTPVIDVAGFLTPAQESRIAKQINSLEDETGFKLRVLAQNYPETPGLAVKDYWKVDDNTIVFVADPNMGNILNFNVGASVDLNVPRSFWSRLAGSYGNIFFWKEKGEDASIEAAVQAIGKCLREPAGPGACADIK